MRRAEAKAFAVSLLANYCRIVDGWCTLRKELWEFPHRFGSRVTRGIGEKRLRAASTIVTGGSTF
jgi:hypothetical protein